MESAYSENLNKPESHLHSYLNQQKAWKSGCSLAWFRTSACHVDDPGSNPGNRTILSIRTNLFSLPKVVNSFSSANISCSQQNGLFSEKEKSIFTPVPYNPELEMRRRIIPVEKSFTNCALCNTVTYSSPVSVASNNRQIRQPMQPMSQFILPVSRHSRRRQLKPNSHNTERERNQNCLRRYPKHSQH